MVSSLPVVNLTEAKYECIFGRGCDGICCQNGRPPVYPEEQERIDPNLDRFLPLLRPEARELVERMGYLSNRIKDGAPMMRVVEGWCVFFNKGCVLHKVGAAEGDAFKYKPLMCSLFPLAKDKSGEWHVRQWGYKGEAWDLFCLNPQASLIPASESLKDEVELARAFTEQEEQARNAASAKSNGGGESQ
jgi:Fe-S-cluster containining protein